MSYINDALKKAQHERDGRYERFGGLISPAPGSPGGRRKRRLPLGVAIMALVLIPVGLLLAVYALRQPSPISKRQPPIAAEKQAALPSPPQPAVEEAVSADEAPARPAAEKAPVPVAAVPAVRASAGEPAPDDAEARYTEALSAQRRGDLPQAEVLYERVLALDPRHVRALNNLGIVSMGLKKQERAIALLKKAIALKREYVDPYYNLACLYARTNGVAESLGYLKVAMTLNNEVRNWAQKDADLKTVVESPAFKKLMEGQKN